MWSQKFSVCVDSFKSDSPLLKFDRNLIRFQKNYVKNAQQKYKKFVVIIAILYYVTHVTIRYVSILKASENIADKL